MRSLALWRSALALTFLTLAVSRVDAVVTFRNSARLAVTVGTDGPQAIALGDVNKDSWPDILFVDFDADQVGVLLNDREGGFGTDAGRFDTGPGPVAVATGDFDRDGNLDIVTVNFDNRTVTVWYGDGLGAFQGRQDYSVKSEGEDELPVAVAVEDYNNDQIPDLAVLKDTLVYLLKSNGNSRTFTPFAPAAIRTRSRGGFAITTGQFDGNSFPDLAISNEGSDNVSVFLGQGDGTFRGARLLNTGSGPAGIVTGDWDVDATEDIAVVDSFELGDLNVSLLYGNGDGTFQERVETTAQTDSVAIAAADLDSSGRLDFAVTMVTTGQFNVFVLLYDPSDPSADNGYVLQAPSGLSLGQGQVAVQAGDLNNDGRPDLVALGEDTEVIGVFLNTTGDATPTRPAGSVTPTPPASPSPPPPTPTGPTVTATPTATRTPTATPTFVPVPYGVCSTAVGGQPVSVTTGTLKGLGPPFIAVADKANNKVAILTAQISSGAADPCAVLGLQRGVDVQNIAAPVAVLARDLDGDNNGDLAVVGSAGLSVFYGDGTGTFVAASSNPMPAGGAPRSVAVADFNRDGGLDVIVANESSDDASIFLGSGQRQFAAACPVPVGRRAGLVAASDLNVDGRQDFVVASANDVRVLLQKAPASPTPGTPSSCSTLPGFTLLTLLDLPAAAQGEALVVASFDPSDTVPDLAVALSAGSNSGSLLVLFGRSASGGSVMYERQNPVTVPAVSGSIRPAAPSALGAGDVTRNGRTDLVVADRNNDDVAVFLANGTGGFGSPILIPVGGIRPVALAMSDIDGDGRSDAVTANEGDSSISILLTSKPPPTPTPPPSATPTITTTFTVTATPTASATETVTPTPSATTTGTRTRAPTSTPTLTPTATFKPGTINLQGSSCAIAGTRPDSGSPLALSLAACVLALARWRVRSHAQ